MSDEQTLPINDGANDQDATSTPPSRSTGQAPLPDEISPPPSNGNGDNQDYSTLLAELEDTKSKLVELTQISQQALADLQNYKKRTEEEKIQFVAFANTSLINDLLPILDNIERATTHLPEDPAAKEWANGILIIFQKLSETLSARGLEMIPTANLTFDPNLHEAVMTENGPQDQITKELEKGYRIGDKVIRRSKVMVGNGSSATESEQTPSSQ